MLLKVKILRNTHYYFFLGGGGSRYYAGRGGGGARYYAGGGSGGGGGSYYTGGGGDGGSSYYAAQAASSSQAALSAARAAHSAAADAHSAAADAAATGHRIERRIEDLDHRLTHMDGKLDGLDSKLDGLEDKFEGLGRQLEVVGDHVNKMRLAPLKGAFQSFKEAYVSYEGENYGRANDCFQEAEDKALTAFHQASISAIVDWVGRQYGSITLRIGPLSNKCRCRRASVDKNCLFSLRQATLIIGLNERNTPALSHSHCPILFDLEIKLGFDTTVTNMYLVHRLHIPI